MPTACRAGPRNAGPRGPCRRAASRRSCCKSSTRRSRRAGARRRAAASRCGNTGGVRTSSTGLPGWSRRARTGPASRGACRRASAAAAVASLPSSRGTSAARASRSMPRWRCGCHAPKTRRRRFPDCHAGRRRRTSRDRGGSWSSRAAARPWFEITCAVPVLPQTSLPGIAARLAVPLPPLTTSHIPSRIACSFSGDTSTCDCGAGSGTASSRGRRPWP